MTAVGDATRLSVMLALDEARLEGVQRGTTQQGIATDLGLSVTTVSGVIRDLKRERHLRVIQRRGKPNWYVPTDTWAAHRQELEDAFMASTLGLT